MDGYFVSKFLEKGYMIEILLRLHKHSGKFLQNKYRSDFKISASPARRNHKILIKNGIIKQTPNSSKLLFELTEMGKIIAQMVSNIEFLLQSNLSDSVLHKKKNRKEKDTKRKDFAELIPLLADQIEDIFSIIAKEIPNIPEEQITKTQYLIKFLQIYDKYQTILRSDRIMSNLLG